MPNQRAKTKTYLGGFVERGFKDKISQLAREAGMDHDQFGFALRLIQGPLNNRRKVTRALDAQPNQQRTLPAVPAPNGAYTAGTGQGTVVIPAAQSPPRPAPRAH